MTRRTAVAAPALPPDADALIQMISEMPLSDLVRLSAKLEELMLSRRLQLQRSPRRADAGRTNSS